MAVNTTVEVTMPPMGDSVSDGTILEWHKQEGDEVAEDETLVEISTDKVDAEVPAPTAGRVVKIHAAEGDTVDVGAVLAEIAPTNGAPPAGNGRDVVAPAVTSGDERSEAGPAAEAALDASRDGAAPAATSGGEQRETVIDITMPAMGESVSEGTILEWAKSAGDSVDEDETLVEISTDKVDAEVPSPATGTITEILAEAGETVGVGQVIARMSAGAAAAASTTTAPAPEPTTAPRPAGDVPPSVPEGAKVTPVAARVAAAEGVDLAAVKGTGPGGRISKADVLAAGNGAAPAVAPEGAQLLKGASAMLARYMDESRSIPTATSFRTITVTTLDGRRKELKNAGEKVSFTHLIAYAIALAVQQDMPVMSHHFDTEDGKPVRVDDQAVNLGIAVDVEKKDGSRTLMVPVIRDAGRKAFKDFKAAFDELIDKARTNTLTADDLTGANI